MSGNYWCRNVIFPIKETCLLFYRKVEETKKGKKVRKELALFFTLRRGALTGKKAKRT